MTTSNATTRKFYGSVRLGEDELGSHFCEVTVDPYDSREMRAVVYLTEEVEWSDTVRPLGVRLLDVSQDSLLVTAPGVRVEADRVSSRQAHDGVRLSAHVVREEATLLERAGEPAAYHYGYRFPLTSLTSDVAQSVRHGAAGLLRGRHERTAGAVTVVPPSMREVILDGVAVEIGSTLNFHPSPTARYPAEHVVTESLLRLRIPAGAHREPGERARETAGALLRLVSIVERDRIHWTRENYHTADGAGMPVTQRQTTRWAPPPRPRQSLPGPNGHWGDLRGLVTAYDGASNDVRSEVDRVCEEFAVASTAGDLETSLVRWHSVVDFMCKRCGNDKGSAALRIFDTCGDLGVELDDLGDGDVLTKLQNGEKKPGAFLFTHLRNRFVHDGFDVFDGRTADLLEARATVRAIAERMLLARLGAATEGGHLGTTSGPS